MTRSPISLAKRRRSLQQLGAVGLFVASACSAVSRSQVPIRTPTPETEKRVAALVGQMTLEEKVSQMQNDAGAIPRLNVPAYNWWSEGLHGIARSGYATVFPQAIGLAATWDVPLIHKVADTISTEARAKNGEALREGNHSIYYGLDIWSPNINIFRDPRWGRGQETYGEDPFLTGRLGVAFVEGLQGSDPTYYKTIATPKHFAVHSGPENTRHTANVDPSAHDLEDTYLPAFRATVTQAKAGSVMCAYNAVDGAPACANTMLLQDRLRKDWGFNGYVTSDCAAITDIAIGHHYSLDLEHGAVAAVRAGTDTSCGKEYAVLVKAVQDGLISEKEIDRSVNRLFTARFELGLFDDPTKVEYARIPFSEDDSPAHRALALETAEKSMVLLKNDGILPLKKSVKIAVIGPNAASLAAIEGNYNAVPSQPILPLAGLENALGVEQIRYAQGSPYVSELPVPVPRTLLHPAAGDPRFGLKGEYFDNVEFKGSPSMTRVDQQVEFDWNAASPDKSISASHFGVRWAGTIQVPVAGDYNFSFTLAHCYPCGDAESLKVYFDDKPLSDQPVPASDYRSSGLKPFTLHFADAKPHTFRIEYTHKAKLFGAGITLSWMPPIDAEREAAIESAKQADVVVAFVGLSPELEGEEMPVHVKGFDGGDRTSIELPAVQEKMLEAVATTGKPLVIVLMNGSALAVDWAKQHANAIVEAWYPGEEGGAAIADVLTGTTNPAGRLPITFYANTRDLPPFDDYSMAGRTYRYYAGTPLWGFGYGLSYSTFQWTNLKLSTASLKAGDPMLVDADVENMSDRAGDAVSELYLTPPAEPTSPRMALVGFDRLTLAPHAKQHVHFMVDARALSTVDADGARAVRSGDYVFHLGGTQPTDTSDGSMSAAFTIHGNEELPR
ncbi:MAG: glycoside hydrolase family 3 C-terminal domain-containing protein [Acidobacteriaceae bacterium]|jgi:beta-glucosidase